MTKSYSFENPHDATLSHQSFLTSDSGFKSLEMIGASNGLSTLKSQLVENADLVTLHGLDSESDLPAGQLAMEAPESECRVYVKYGLQKIDIRIPALALFGILVKTNHPIVNFFFENNIQFTELIDKRTFSMRASGYMGFLSGFPVKVVKSIPAIVDELKTYCSFNDGIWKVEHSPRVIPCQDEIVLSKYFKFYPLQEILDQSTTIYIDFVR
jgi:hypothetical protein